MKSNDFDSSKVSWWFVTGYLGCAVLSSFTFSIYGVISRNAYVREDFPGWYNSAVLPALLPLILAILSSIPMATLVIPNKKNYKLKSQLFLGVVFWFVFAGFVFLIFMLIPVGFTLQVGIIHR